jgi:hypothetical protein
MQAASWRVAEKHQSWLSSAKVYFGKANRINRMRFGT